MKLPGKVLLLLFTQLLMGMDDQAPHYNMQPTKEENRFDVGKHLVVETEDGAEVHLDVKIKFNINRSKKSITVRFEVINEGELLNSIPRTYHWE